MGRGATAVAWRATDAMERDFAIKVVLRAEYATHSLDAEARRANSLDGRFFRKDRLLRRANVFGGRRV